MAGPAGRRAASSLTPAGLERALEKGAPAPVYLIAGGEAVLADRALQALKRRLVEPGFEMFNYRRLEPSGLDASALAEELRVLPMGGGRRLVVIAPAEGLGRDQLKALGRYAADPAPATCLALVAGEVKEALRTAFPGAAAVDCSPPWEDRIPEHLEGEARAAGVRIERQASLLLAALCGRDLSRAVAELRKAAGRVGPGGTVTAALVRELAGGGEAADVFRVASALARGDPAGAARAARRYLESEDRAEPRVLYECAAHLRRLLAARALVDSGASPAEAAKAVRVFWKDADRFASELPRWSEGRILAAFRTLLAADRRIKRGPEDGAAVIEAYLWQALPRGTGAAGGGRA